MAEIMLVEPRSSRQRSHQHNDGKATIPAEGVTAFAGRRSADPNFKAADSPVDLVAQRQ